MTRRTLAAATQQEVCRGQAARDPCAPEGGLRAASSWNPWRGHHLPALHLEVLGQTWGRHPENGLAARRGLLRCQALLGRAQQLPLAAAVAAVNAREACQFLQMCLHWTLQGHQAPQLRPAALRRAVFLHRQRLARLPPRPWRPGGSAPRPQPEAPVLEGLRQARTIPTRPLREVQ